MFRKILFASVIAAAAFGAAAAHAQDDHHTSVSTRDVDFNRPSDVHGLYNRIRVAADEVCTSQGPVDLNTAKAEKACMDEAVNDAVSSVNQPQLTHLAQNHGRDDTQLAMRDRRDSDDRAAR